MSILKIFLPSRLLSLCWRLLPQNSADSQAFLSPKFSLICAGANSWVSQSSWDGWAAAFCLKQAGKCEYKVAQWHFNEDGKLLQNCSHDQPNGTCHNLISSQSLWMKAIWYEMAGLAQSIRNPIKIPSRTDFKGSLSDVSSGEPVSNNTLNQSS